MLYGTLLCLALAATGSSGLSDGPRVHLLTGPLLPGQQHTFELDAAHRALDLVKDHLGPPAITTLLAQDIATSDAAWHAILANSTGTSHILSEARLRAFNTAYNASTFLTWFGTDTGDPNKLLGAHPEHYVELMHVNASTGVASVDIIESWGPLVTRYQIPAYVTNGPKKPWLKKLPNFPLQSTGEAVLQDGSGLVIADVHNSFRDLGVGEVEAGQKGLEAIISVWFPDGTPEDVLEGLREHQAVEFSNWLSFAQRDIDNGVFVVT